MTAAPSTARYHLAAPRAAAPAPTLDEHQQRVVDHAGGPLLVLAGPGTGKTTTMVEAIVDRIERRGVDPGSVLALTFSRKAAEQLRDRVTGRLGRTLSGGLSSTFHSFAYGLVRRYAPAELYAAPLRLLSAPEQDVVLQELLTNAPESIRWPEPLRAAVGTRGFAREVQTVIARARERGLDPAHLVELGRAEGVPEFEAAGLFLEQYLDVLGDQSAIDYPDLIARGVIEARVHQAELRASYSCVFVDEYQDTDPSQVELLRALAGDGRDLVVVGDPDQSIYGFRGADVRGILEFPRQFPTSTGEPAPVLALGTTRRFGSRLLRASRVDRGRHRDARRHPGSGSRRVPQPRARGVRARARHGRRRHVRHRSGRGRAHRRPAPSRTPRGRHRVERHGGAGAIGPHIDPGSAPGAHGRRRARRGGRRRDAAGA